MLHNLIGQLEAELGRLKQLETQLLLPPEQTTIAQVLAEVPLTCGSFDWACVKLDVTQWIASDPKVEWSVGVSDNGKYTTYDAGTLTGAMAKYLDSRKAQQPQPADTVEQVQAALTESRRH